MDGMAEKVYKTRPHRVLANLVFGVFAAALVGWISTIWLKMPLPYAVGAAVFLLDVLLVIGDNMISIHVSGDLLTVRKRGKERYRFKISECRFRARTESSSGDTECYLTVIGPDGNATMIDCELIGVTKFYELLEDLGVIGEKASVTKIETVKQ